MAMKDMDAKPPERTGGKSLIDVMVYDDDVYVAGMFTAVCEDLGYSVDRSYNGYTAAADIRRLKPKVVIVDIMMPGMDGLTLCKLLKSDPETAAVKIIVASGKPFAEDRQESERCGADFFLPKPFDPAKLRAAMKLLGAPDSTHAGSASPRPTAFQVQVWGCRDSAEVAEKDPTFCLSADLGDRVLVFDAGSGAIGLAAAMRALAKETWVLLSRQESRHVSGLPHLFALPNVGGTLKVAGPGNTRESLHDVLSRLLSAPPPPSLRLFTLSEAAFQLGDGVRVWAMFTRHPGAAMAFRVENRGKVLVYCPFNELEIDDDIQTDFGEKMGRFIRGADVLIHDARYDDADYASHRGQGHGCVRQAMELALREGVRKLVLFNLAPEYPQDHLSRMLDEARKTAATGKYPFKVDLARPGDIIDV